MSEVDWGVGRIVNIAAASNTGGMYCDGCDRAIDHGLALDVSLQPHGTSSRARASLCESCFEEMATARRPGGSFLILAEPRFLDALL